MKIVFQAKNGQQLKEQIAEFLLAFGNKSPLSTDIVEHVQKTPGIEHVDLDQQQKEKSEKKAGRPAKRGGAPAPGRGDSPVSNASDVLPGHGVPSTPADSGASPIAPAGVRPPALKAVPVPVPEALASAPTQDDVRAVMQALSAAKGTPVARDLLAKFKAVRFSELKPVDYASFIGEANALIEFQASDI